MENKSTELLETKAAYIYVNVVIRLQISNILLLSNFYILSSTFGGIQFIVYYKQKKYDLLLVCAPADTFC